MPTSAADFAALDGKVAVAEFHEQTISLPRHILMLIDYFCNFRRSPYYCFRFGDDPTVVLG
ncbi:MAG: hypothetical protein Q7T82_08005 [Armatimonadota bacterium]|nr:hypothetical protein [Armatimonadota bacterium]